MPTSAKPDVQESRFNLRRGEFSIFSDIAFDKHLHRLWLRCQKKISHENLWYSYRPSLLEDDFSDIKVKLND